MSLNEETGLVSGWEVKHSRTRNLPYYYNPETSESSWEPPAGSDPEKLKNHIAKNYSQSNAGPQPKGDDLQGKVRASHLLIKHKDSRRPSSWKEASITRTKNEAMSIILAHEARIRAGQSTLGDLAVSESDCSSARRSGDLGYFGRGDMQKEFEDAAFGLKVGELSHVIETQSGLHLIERTG